VKINRSIRNRLIFAIFLGCLIPYSLGGAYLKAYTEDWLYNNSVDNTNQILYRISELIDGSLVTDMKQEVDMLSSSDSVKNSKNNLQNYTRYERNTFRYQPSTTEKAIEEQFLLLKTSHKDVNFVFLATEDGGYMEYPRFQPAQAYEPRLRPWFTSTIYTKDTIISEPYLTKVSNEMVVGFTKQIRDNKDSVIGVLGITVNLHDLTTSINNIKIGDSGYILLMSPQHKFLVSPHHQKWIMKTPEELGLRGFNAIGKTAETVFETKLDNVDRVLNVVTAKDSGWHIISVVNKAEILQKAKAVTNILLFIYALTLVLIFLIVFQISKRFTRPVLEISSVINRMTDFDFNFSTNLKGYTKREDEIGIVATALVELHDNYTEFIDQVKYIDKEIRNIDIEKNELLKVEVSGNNPFHGVIDSMNILLAKLNQYFNQLKVTNKEIVAKNELLTRSKKELLEQLEKVDQQNEYINFLALHDSLTKLPNRRQFIDLLTGKLHAGAKGAVILLDLDDFKGINDTLGHVFGDRVIEAIAARLAEISDDNVVVSRFGGDEFLILMELRDASELDQLIHRIRNAFGTIVHIDNNDIEIRFSMGISLFPEDGTDVNQLVMNADLAMYAVKDSGKNGYQYFNSSMMNSQINKSRIEILLRDAIENDGFELVYQPLVNLKTGEIYGYEALLRLKGSDMSPAEFVPIAEINGSIIRIGRIVTEKVIRQLSDWKRSGLELKPVSINFSANQLHDSGYLHFISQHLKKNGIESRYIEIEITESIFMESMQATLSFLKKLKEIGISISIDDFGTGYSSLNYLTFLPVDKIKLDRALNVKFLEMENAGVMNSLISLVHSFGMTVIAEGIETLDQVERLKAAECDMIQGYFYSRPLAPEQIPEIHANRYCQ
jgi:diguanylate cyclase (GGDEF)-like protein